MGLVAFPELEVQLCLPVDGIHLAQHVTKFHLLACLYVYRSQLAVESEIIPVLHEHAFVVSRHHDNLLDHAPKDSLDSGPLLGSKVDTVIERHCDRGIYRMLALSEMLHYRTLARPRKFALVRGEFCREPGVHACADLLAARCLAASAGLAGRIDFGSDQPFDFAVERLDLPALGIELLLVFLLFPVQFL